MASNNAQALEQELIRKRLQPTEYIRMIEEALSDLCEFGNNMSKNQIDAKRAIMAGAGQMLNKCLPDLRAIEIAPEAQSPVKFVFMSGAVATSGELKKALAEPKDDEPAVSFKFNS